MFFNHQHGFFLFSRGLVSIERGSLERHIENFYKLAWNYADCPTEDSADYFHEFLLEDMARRYYIFVSFYEENFCIWDEL